MAHQKSFFKDDYRLIELQRIEDEELKQRIWAGTAQLIMRRVFETDILPYLGGFSEHLRKIRDENFSYLEMVLWYVSNRVESEKTGYGNTKS